MGLCGGTEHAHESWQEYEQCYADIQGKHTLHRELCALRGAKNELCQVFVDIFADHAEAQCPLGPGFENQSLLHFWDDPIGSFVRFIGTMVEHARGVQSSPCPLCNVQEDQHDYAICLRMDNVELKEGMLNVTTGRRHSRDPPLDPNPPGPTPGTTHCKVYLYHLHV